MTIHKEKNFWLAAILVFLIDQVTKFWALLALPMEEELVMNKHFSLHLNYNEITIMLIHEDPFGLGKFYFDFIWLGICALITFGVWWVIRQPSLNNKGWTEEFAKTGLFLILGAAWGNAFDRIFREGVVDFIQLNTFKETTVPIFNIADVMIYMGEFCVIVAWIMILVDLLKKRKENIQKLPNIENQSLNINKSE